MGMRRKMRRFIFLLMIPFLLLQAGQWETPDTTNDPSSGWRDPNGEGENKIYDDDTGTYGNTLPATASGAWSVFIELLYDGGLLCDSLRYWARATYEDSIDLDVYYSGGWHDIFKGVNGGLQWNVVDMGGTQDITKARVSLRNKDGNSRNVRLHEFDIWGEAIPSAGQVIMIQMR